MDFINGDYIISEHNLDQTFDLLIAALRDSSYEQRNWSIFEDRKGSRLTAELHIQQSLQLARTLRIEANLFAIDESRTRLELLYSIDPMFNIAPSEKIVNATVDRILDQLGAQQAIYSRTGQLPAELAAISKVAEGNDPLLKGFEIAIIFNIIFFIIGLFPSMGWVPSAVITTELALGIPAAIVVSSVSRFRKPTANVLVKRSPLEIAVASCLALLGGIAMLLVVVPLMAFGLCIGIMFITQGR